MSKQNKSCLWHAQPGDAQRYCQLFDRDCDACGFNTQETGTGHSYAKGGAFSTRRGAGFPDCYLLSPYHFWVAPSNDGHMLIGLDDFLAEALFHVRCLILPDAISALQKGRTFGWIIDLFGTISLPAPVSGLTVLKNDLLLREPDSIKTQPYSFGWLLEIRPQAGWRNGLISTAAAKQKIARAKARLKDAIIRAADSTVLVDGGSLCLDRIIETMPEIYLQILRQILQESATEKG